MLYTKKSRIPERAFNVITKEWVHRDMVCELIRYHIPIEALNRMFPMDVIGWPRIPIEEYHAIAKENPEKAQLIMEDFYRLDGDFEVTLQVNL